MPKTWKNGLQGRLKDTEDTVDALSDDLAALEVTVDAQSVLVEDTPVNAVAAAQTLGYSASVPAEGETVVVDGVTYTFMDSVAAAGDILIGVDVDATATNLSRAINKSGGTEGSGQDYMSAGGVAHPRASSGIDTGTNTITLTAIVKGAAGNAYTLVSTSGEYTPGGATFAGGIDGTIALAGTAVFDAGFLYVATADNTVADTNWKKATLGDL